MASTKSTTKKKMTYKDIAKKYNVREATARYWISRKFSAAEMEKRRQHYKGPNQSKIKSIEGVSLEELARRYGFAMSTLVTFAKKGLTLRQIDVKYQRRSGIPNHKKTYCNVPFATLASDLGVPLSAISKMVSDGILIEDMPAYVAQHRDEMQTKEGKPKKDTSATSVSSAEMRSLHIVEMNRILLARKL